MVKICIPQGGHAEMLKPLNDKIIVKPGKAEETTASGIVLPDTARKKPREGEVLAVGPGRLTKDGERTQLEVKVGDYVIYSDYAGTQVTIDGEDIVILDESSVLAVKDAPATRKGKK
jgi:chaperonin GroES